MKRIIAFLILFLFISSFTVSASSIYETKTEAEVPTVKNPGFTVDASSALLMEANTGEILFCQNETATASPASVTKIMTLLLTCEALAEGRISLSDKILISAYAASMGGSQVFLKEGEEITVEDLVKCTVIASANDAAVALAEHVFGSEECFVSEMNKKAHKLGMNNTSFENVTGLDDTTENHYTCALDIAIMSRALISHEIILKYSSIWQDTIRNGEFTLTNTNRLVRYYDGCNGLKTGSTDKAGYCISATAKRDGMQLIAVVMGAETRDVRNSVARTLLDYGFANFALYRSEPRKIEGARILGAKKPLIDLNAEEFSVIIPKKHSGRIEICYDIPKELYAPLKRNDTVGEIIYKIDGKKIGTSSIYVSEDVEKIEFWDIFIVFLTKLPFFDNN